jgi:hypothetical protein
MIVHATCQSGGVVIVSVGGLLLCAAIARLEKIGYTQGIAVGLGTLSSFRVLLRLELLSKSLGVG